MISMVNENATFNGGLLGEITPTSFGSVSLTEASYIAMQSIDEMMNDLRVSTILYEYQYALENGHEIIYEADDATGKKKEKVNGVVDKIVAAIRKFLSNIYGLVQTAMSKLSTMIQTTVAKAGLSKKAFMAVTDEQYESYFDHDTRKLIGFTVSPFDLVNKAGSDLILPFTYNKDNDIKVYSVNEVVSKFTREYTSEDKKYYTKDAVSKVLFGEGKNIGKEIFKLKKSMDKLANDGIKVAKAAGTDKLSDIMDQYQLVMKRNTAATSGILKVYINYVQCCSILAKAAVKHVKIEDKAQKADAAGKARTGEYDDPHSKEYAKTNTRLDKTSIFGSKKTARAQKEAEREAKRAAKAKKKFEKKNGTEAQ